MAELFDPGVRANAPDEPTVAALVAFGYGAAAVRGWTTARAATVLAGRRKEAAARDRRRAAAERDGREGFAAGRGQPTPMERAAAAEFLAEAEGRGAEAVSLALASCLYALTDDETTRMAGYVYKLFTGAAR